ncbi:MAG: hypothetical protein WD768_00070 [Phycisphaeraceae bacterium]
MRINPSSFPLRLAVACAVGLCLITSPALGAEKAQQQPLDIRPMKSDQWKASLEDVKKVLESSAAELWKHFPDRKLDPIIVEPKGGPIVLFRRGKNGEYFVRLNTGESYWAQYAYQFAHEMCHILCTYREGEGHNKWFEESLCELASLYALRQMSETWKTNPPYSNWKGYAPALGKYADERMNKAKLAEGQTLAKWYVEQAAELRKSATQRELNQIAATALLPLFEKTPEHWEAVTWLNAGEPVEDRHFDAYLAAWHANVPQRHKAFVAALAKELGVMIQAKE